MLLPTLLELIDENLQTLNQWLVLSFSFTCKRDKLSEFEQLLISKLILLYFLWQTDAARSGKNKDFDRLNILELALLRSCISGTALNEYYK